MKARAMVLKNLTTKAYQIGRQSGSGTLIPLTNYQLNLSSAGEVWIRPIILQPNITKTSQFSRLVSTFTINEHRKESVNKLSTRGSGLTQLSQAYQPQERHEHLDTDRELNRVGLRDLNIDAESVRTDKPLYLTPYIRQGNIQRAQDLAQVTGLTDQIRSYSGYLTVNENHNSNLFFWFFPALHNPEEAPVLLWLNGGPGASSMFGLFAGHGPIFVDKNQQLQHREYPWTLNHSVIYIDNPVGTGFSFTDNDKGFARTLDNVACDLYEALQQFFTLFPSYRSHDFYVTGQSYTGKYAPAISHKIHLENSIREAATRINLRGMAIGAGMCDPAIQADYGSFLYNIGLIDEHQKEYFDEEYKKLLNCIQNKEWTLAHKILQHLIIGWPRPIVSHFETITGYSYNFNFIQQDMPQEYENYIKFVENETVQRLIHVGKRDFGKMRSKVYMSLSDDFAQSVKPLIEELLDQDYKILFYASQLDIIVHHPGVSKFLQSLKWKHSEDYLKQSRTSWRIQNGIVGYAKECHNLVHLLLLNTGHIAPQEQPERCLDMITRFTRNIPFQDIPNMQ